MEKFKIDISNILKTMPYDFDVQLSEQKVWEIVDLVLIELKKKNFLNKDKRKVITQLIKEEINKEMEIKHYIKKTIKRKINETQKKIEEDKIEKFVIEMLMNNEDKRLKSEEIVKKLKEQKNLVHKDYYNLRTRTFVYSIISKKRRELESENYQNGYIISKHDFSKKDIEKKDVRLKIDGWEYTKNFEKIQNYFKCEIEDYTKYVKSMQKKLKEFNLNNGLEQ
ncbi:hypothetical protein [Spiroplasma sp. BIUS-1]|uniref:hypothetical protein n=1 Tax=Spiroplasma sp. BIUS-1 TaxID=216964 RepID=UPI0013977A60|nr:hypothetical protein [Spiroplasma sp. BIUS-1]QHX36770.1 hypothetical protein SBIUS_v1c05170 [Spiroplasma sp. BIUS-1]